MDHYHLRGWKIWFSLDQHTLSEPGRCHLLWDNFSRWSLVTCLPAVLIKLSGAYWTQQHFFSYFVRKVPPLLSLHRAVKAVHLQTQLLWLWVIQESSTPHHCLAATFAFGRRYISSFSCPSLPISGSLVCLIPCLDRPCSTRLQRPCWCEHLPITSTPKKVFLERCCMILFF